LSAPLFDVENPKQAAFLVGYVQSKQLTEAQRLSHVHRHSHYKWLENDPKYPAYFRRARKIFADQIEEEAYRRAFIGRDMPIYAYGRIIGHYKVYADKLAVFLLKALRPEIYGANPDIFRSGECPLKITIHREGDDRVYDNSEPLPKWTD